MTFTMRPYQIEALDETAKAVASGQKNLLLTLMTGAGKTVLFVNLKSTLGITGTTLVIAHREELLTQARDKWLQQHPEDRVGIERAGESVDGERYDAIFASVQSLQKKRLERLVSEHEIALVVIDECFPEDTKVDGRPIKEIRLGDLVDSFNHHTGRIEKKPVTRLYRSPAVSLCRVHLEDGSHIDCTTGHPFWTGDKYTPAISLISGDSVYRLQKEGTAHNGDQAQKLCGLREFISAPVLDHQDGPDLFGCVQTDPSGGPTPPRNIALHLLRKARRMRGPEDGRVSSKESRILFGRLSDGMEKSLVSGNDGQDQPSVRIGTDETQQSNVSRRYSEKGQRKTARNTSQTAYSGRQRKGTDRTRDASGSRTIDGASDSDDAYGSAVRLPQSLQTGPGRRRTQTVYRNRRFFSRGSHSSATRSEKDSLLIGARVDRVEVLEPGSDGRFGDLCRDGHVYNIEVEVNHNYFVDGVLVHNCHHSSAKSYQNILTAINTIPVESSSGLRPGCGGPVLIGVTATPDRLDKKSVREIFPYHVYDYPILRGMREKYACPVRAYRLVTDVDLRDVRIEGGDFAVAQLSERINVAERRDLVLEKWKEIGGLERRTIVFCASVAHAEAAAEGYRRLAPNTVCVTGKTANRAALLEQFSQGPIPSVLVNVDVATEGYDAPNITMIVMEAPTASGGKFAQRIGRGLRLFEGAPGLPDPPKKDLVLLDVVDQVKTHARLQTTPRLLGLPANFDLGGEDLLEARDTLDKILDRDPALTLAVARLDDNEEGAPTTFADLKAHLKRVMLFAPESPRGATADLSSFCWSVSDEEALVSGDLEQSRSYTLSLPAPKYGPKPGEPAEKRVYTLLRNADNTWHLLVQTDSPERVALEGEANRLMEDVSRMRASGRPEWLLQQSKVKADACRAQARSAPLVTLKEFTLQPSLRESLERADAAIRQKHPSGIRIIDENAEWRFRPATPSQMDLCRKKKIPLPEGATQGEAAQRLDHFFTFAQRF